MENITNPFKAYLSKRNESPFSFSKRSGLSVLTVYKLYKGGTIRRDTARKVVRHSNKELSLQDFGYG